MRNDRKLNRARAASSFVDVRRNSVRMCITTRLLSASIAGGKHAG